MTNSDLVENIRTLMTEITNVNEGSMIAGLSEDPLKLDAYIARCLPMAVALCSKLSPRGGVNPKKAATTGTGAVSISTFGNEKLITLPSDYIRLDHLKISSWERPVNTIMDPNSTLALAQYNSKTKSDVDNPVVVDGYDADGKKAMLLFPCGATDTISLFVYDCKYDSTQGLLTNNASYESAVMYMTASMIYESFEAPVTAEKMRTMAMGYLS